MATPVLIALKTTGAATAKRDLRGVRTEVAGVGGSLKRLAVVGGAATGVAMLTRGIVGLAKSSVQAEAQYSTTMRLIAAATKAPQRDMSRLNDLAIELGAKTQFSAGEAADAMLELAKAGLDTKTIMGGGVAGTLQLAAAGGTELGTAATIASNAMNAFNLEGRDMASVAAALAGGANASSASVESLGQGLAQASAGAVNAGLSLQETVAALSAFDAAGIKGSDAGTSLKTMLQRLVPSTAKASKEMSRLGLDFTDANGEFLSLTQIAEQLRRRLGGLTAEQRNQALATVFGSDATRAASVLMRQGGEGIRKYIKATNDQSAAQKMAKARMEGTEGALERLSGVVETAKLRLGQELAPAVQSGADALGDKLLPVMESVIDVGKELHAAAAPGIEAVLDVLRDLIPEGDAAGDVFQNVLLPAVRAGSDLLGIFADIVGAIPDPIKDIGVQAGIAALILPRLTGAAASAGASVTGRFAAMKASASQFAAEMTYAETRTQRLGQVARGAAGLGGMLALAQGAKKAGTETGDLLTIAGGVATGFAVGGPIGAALGGAAGLFTVISQETDKAAASTSAYSTENLNLRDSLDQVSGAATRATRELIAKNLQEQGLLSSASALGIASRDIVSAVLGEEGARKRLNAAIDANKLKGGALATDQQIRQSDAAQNLAAYIGNGAKAFKRQADAVRDAAGATATWREALRGIPKEVRTRVQALGTDATLGEIRELKRRYDLTPKQVRTIVQALGSEKLKRELREVQDRMKDTGKAKADTGPFRESLRSGLNRAKEDGRIIVGGIVGELKSGTAKARPNLDPFASSLRARISALQGDARSGGSGIGTALGAGVSSGIGAMIGGAVASAQQLVRQAIAAARAEARAKSPSRETMDLGRDMARGLGIGMRRESEFVNESAERVTRGLIKRLKEATQKYRELIREAREYARSLRDQVLATGSLAALTGPEGEALTPAGMLDQLRARVRDAQRFADLIEKLRKDKLNKTSLQQIIEAGVEGGGLAAAETIAAGGQAMISEVNALTGQLTAAGQQVGETGAEVMYGAGLDSIQALIAGLRDRARDLKKVDGIADQLARRLTKALRAALKAQGIRVEDLFDTGAGNRGQARAREFSDTMAAAMRSDLLSGSTASSVRVRLSAQQLTALQRGREVQADLDVFHSAGGRRRK